jgi:hypothetical protein
MKNPKVLPWAEFTKAYSLNLMVCHCCFAAYCFSFFQPCRVWHDIQNRGSGGLFCSFFHEQNIRFTFIRFIVFFPEEF